MSSPPERIGIRELRQHASRYVELAAQGIAVEVTRHGKLVARLVGISDGDDPLAGLVREGTVEEPREEGDVLDVLPVPAGDGPSVSEELRRMRDEERW